MSAGVRRWVAGMVLGLPVLAGWRTARGAADGTAATSRVSAAAPEHRQERTVWDSVYTMAQAERGQAAYAKECARCHAAELTGADAAPALTGSAFTSAWDGQLLAVLHERIQTAMPTDTPGVYGTPLVTDVIAYLLRFNGFPAGSTELTHEQGALQTVRFVLRKEAPAAP